MYEFDFEVVEKDNVSCLVKVNDNLISVEYDGFEYDYCIVEYNDDNKLEYVSEVNEKYNDKECEYVLSKIYKDYLN
jgi:hypothetical protein